MADGTMSGIDAEILRQAMGVVAARNSKRRMYSGPRTAAAVAAEYERLICIRMTPTVEGDSARSAGKE
jgi:hypothetical protein